MAGPTFQVDPEDAVRSVELEGLTILFHRPSGMTHVLASPAPEILAALREGAATLEALTKRLGERYELGDATALGERLAELEAAGLVTRL